MFFSCELLCICLLNPLQGKMHAHVNTDMPLLCFVAAGMPCRAFFSFVLCGGSLDWLKLPSPIFSFGNNNLKFNIFLGELNISHGKNILIACSKIS